jgi:hypothetical protein
MMPDSQENRHRKRKQDVLRMAGSNVLSVSRQKMSLLIPGISRIIKQSTLNIGQLDDIEPVGIDDAISLV